MSENRMRNSFVGESFDDIFRDVLLNVTHYPENICSPRNEKIKECIATTLVLRNPRKRFISNPIRKANYGFGVGEFLWYWKGKQDLETMLYYNKRMKNFSDDGETLNSCYGHLLMNAKGDDGKSINQWELAKNTLINDPDSRRCVLQIHQPKHQAIAASQAGTKDVPCTLSMQFFIRNDKLDLHVNMRSNDVIWGLAYDLFSFTLFQECMLIELRQQSKFRNLEIGTYYHTTGSLHLYERHFELAERILEHYGVINSISPITKFTSETMEQIDSIENLEMLCRDEELLRTKRIDKINETIYFGGLKRMAEYLNHHREMRDGK